jgi:hypothetical protein
MYSAMYIINLLTCQVYIFGHLSNSLLDMSHHVYMPMHCLTLTFCLLHSCGCCLVAVLLVDIQSVSIIYMLI